MTGMDDQELLAEYTRSESEAAFAALVARYVNLVYSAGLRFTGNPHHAEEITQAVFVILARKAGGLRRGTVLSGWLYQTARLTAANFVKGEIRRQRREQEAYMQSTLTEPEPAAWEQIAPLLDEAMGHLGETDRNAVVLRFFENKTALEVAAKLKLSESAVHKRVNRAVEKLRRFFTRRGIASTAESIAGAIAANSVQAAPTALAKSVTAVAITKGAIAAVSTLTLVKGTLKMMTWLKLKFSATVGASVIIGIAVSTIVVAQQTKGPNTNTPSNVGIDDPLLIVPGVSVGKVKAGMTEDDVVAALGQPERKQGEVLIYNKRFGFSVVCSRKKIVGAVFCGGGVDFKGHTKEGIGIDSRRDNLIKAFGQPTSAEPWAADQEQLEYKPLGLTFILQKGRVFHIVTDLRKQQ